jgi:hypothetical protein
MASESVASENEMKMTWREASRRLKISAASGKMNGEERSGEAVKKQWRRISA